MEHLVYAALALLVAFTLVAAVDGLYLHLWTYRLHARADSRTEHLTHTLHACLYPVWVYLLFIRHSGGALLWLALAVVLVDFAVESWDVLIERRSRAGLGGLSSGEYWLHVVAITLRVAAIALVLAARPPAAWTPGAAWTYGPAHPPLVAWTAAALVVLSLPTAAQHLWLLRPRYVQPAR